MPHARIYRPSKPATQSGRAPTMRWLLTYEVETPRRPDPLMGWASAADTLNEVKLRFDTLDEAIAYAKKNGLDYSVIEPNDFKFRPKSYADNFRWQRPS